jgi:hypothetical protein
MMGDLSGFATIHSKPERRHAKLIKYIAGILNYEPNNSFLNL